MPYAGVARAADEDPVVARVNGVDIRQSDLAFAEEEIGGNMPTIPPEQKRDYLVNYLVDVIVLSQAAEKQKLGDRPDVKRRLAFDHNRLLDGMCCCRTPASRRCRTKRNARSMTKPSSR